MKHRRKHGIGMLKAIDRQRRLYRLVRANRRDTMTEITNEMNIADPWNVSQCTVHRILLAMELRSRCLIRVPMLTAIH